MEVPSSEPPSEIEANRLPLLMDQQEIHSHAEHIVDIPRNGDGSSSSSHDDRLDTLDNVDRQSTRNQGPVNETSVSTSNIANSRNSSLARRSEGHSHRHRSPLNSGLWIGVELVVTVVQIIASIIVLSLSRNENPQAPLFAWVVGYASGCVATLPILYWRYRNRNQGSEEGRQLSQGSLHSNSSSEPAPYTTISVSPSSEGGNQQTEISALGNGQIAQSSSSCLNGLVDHFKMALDCFFAVWFVVGNVWIFGGHSSPSDAPKLYRLCIVFLTFSCIGYAMPFILCAMICCCLPCIISVLGFREDHSVTRGATSEFINALPTYKFRSRKNSHSQNINSDSGESGLLASATEKDRRLSGQDSVCCICLAKYKDNDELMELPCSHLFHAECIGKWLKINASCPLCKLEVGERVGTSPSVANSSHHHSESRLGNRPAEGVYGSTMI